jgi:hypothetical protein
MPHRGDAVEKQTWAKQFARGLASGTDEHGDRLRRIVEWGDAPPSDEDELFLVGWNALAHAYSNKALRHLEDLTAATEPPIENAMLLALCVAAHDVASNVRYKKGRHVFGDLEDMPDVLVIEPQAQLGEYRVDFLLTYQECIPDLDRKEKLKDGTEIPGVKDVTVHLIVECDGHDFHDRSKEQASRDRERDRELKKLDTRSFGTQGQISGRIP